MSSEAADLAAIRIATRRAALPWLDAHEVERATVAAVSNGIDAARRRGAHSTLHRDGRAVAAVTWYDDPAPWFGAPSARVTVDAGPGDADALAWAAERLGVALSSVGPAVYYPMEAAHASALMPAVLRAGLGVDSLGLIGRCDEGLAALGSFEVERALERAGATLRAASAEDVDAIIALNRSVFAREPEYCWFGASPTYLESLRSELESAVGAVDPPYVLCDAEGMFGWFRASLSRGGEWGAGGSLGIALERRGRGLGLMRLFYAVALRDLRAAGATTYRGGTSQPPVLSLGRKLGQRLAQIHVRAASGFGPEHFGDWLPPRG